MPTEKEKKKEKREYSSAADLSSLEIVNFNDEIPPIPLDDYNPLGDFEEKPLDNEASAESKKKTTSPITCKSCGNKLLKGDKVCPVCGHIDT